MSLEILSHLEALKIYFSKNLQSSIV